MRRGILLIDRGSREAEARAELEAICEGVRDRTAYDYVGYCFLEVLPPFIPEVMKEALSEGLDELTVVPYFLYPGKKLKAAVCAVTAMQKGTRTRIRVARPMRMHPTLVGLVRGRVRAALEEGGMGDLPDGDVDVLIIGHGSVDPNAKRSLDYVIDAIKDSYRSAEYCFLEIEQPDIAAGIASCESRSPKALAIVFYFLHEGAHVKRDIYADLNPALASAAGIGRALITRHLGADPQMIRLIIERAEEAESHAR